MLTTACSASAQSVKEVYDLEAGCGIAGSDGKIIYKPLPNNTAKVLRYMLSFENDAGGDNNQLDCILLQPIDIFSAN